MGVSGAFSGFLKSSSKSLACTILRDGEPNICSGLDRVEQGVFRKTIIKCILATDMAHHQGLCQKLIGCNSAEDFQSTVSADRQFLMNICVLQWETARKWEDRICQEFTAQAAKETEQGLTPEPFMQFKMEDMKQRGKLQRDFIDFVLRPLWEPFSQPLLLPNDHKKAFMLICFALVLQRRLEPQLHPCLTNLIKNRNLYELRRIYGSDQLDEMPEDAGDVPPGAAAGVKLEDVEQCHQHKREALGPPAVKNTSACANPFAPIPQADREARDREPRERERSKSPRFQPWPPTAGGGGPRHPPQACPLDPLVGLSTDIQQERHVPMRARATDRPGAAGTAAPGVAAAKDAKPSRLPLVVIGFSALGLALWALAALRLHPDDHRAVSPPLISAPLTGKPRVRQVPNQPKCWQAARPVAPRAAHPKPRQLQALPPSPSGSPELVWSLRWLAPALPKAKSEESFALAALANTLGIAPGAGDQAAGTVQVLLRATRPQARQNCLDLMKEALPRSHQTYNLRERDTESALLSTLRRGCFKKDSLMIISSFFSLILRLRRSSTRQDCHASEWHFAVSNANGLCVSATRPAGLFRFAATLRQLLQGGLPAFVSDLPNFLLEDWEGLNVCRGSLPQDWPRVCWRGLQLDAVRHFMPVAFLKRYLEEMAFYKANFFHWHLTDDQSWRLFLRSRPKLVESSKQTSPEFYSEEDVLNFAKEHFITVVPVIETPGHVLAALAAYPELSCDGTYFEVPKQRIGTYKEALCVGKASTFDFAKDVFGNVARLFPGRWIHIGGDEVVAESWWTSDHTRAFAGMAGLRNLAVDLMESWFCAVGKILKELDRQPIAVADDFPFHTISSPMKSVYLDYPVASIDFNKSLQVLPSTGPRILGGCATMWTEDAKRDVFAKVFPRFMAIAERFWGGVPDRARDLDMSLWFAAHTHCEQRLKTDAQCGRFTVKDTQRSPLFAHARITTTLESLHEGSWEAFGEYFHVGRAFDADEETYFWAVSPQAGDLIEVVFINEENKRKRCLGKWLKGLVVKTGSKDRPSDRLEQGYLKVAQWVAEDGLLSSGGWGLKWTVVCSFQSGLCNGDEEILTHGPVVMMRIQVAQSQTKWMALSEVQVEEAKTHPEHPTEEEIQEKRGHSNERIKQLVSNVLEKFSSLGSTNSSDADAPTSAAPRHAARGKGAAPARAVGRGGLRHRAERWRNATREAAAAFRNLTSRNTRNASLREPWPMPGHLEHAPPQALPEALPEWEVDHTELRLEELLGTGSTAEVYRAAWHGTDLSMEFKREISVLLRLRHPNLVLFMGACTKAPQALIISEFCAGGTVFALLHHRRQLQLPWRLRLQLALDVAKGMNFLHRRQVVHRDLKSLNLLLLAPVPEQPIEQLPQVKVSDFGLSRAFPDPTQACMTSGAGTYHWMAPEVLSGQGYDEKDAGEGE
eukprot:g10756.t1